jgi:multiple sugar transport system ATP-binding protein
MVFQNYALYPHMKVFDNMAFSLRIAKLAPEAIRERVHRAAGILGLTELLERYPRQLSGGQRQRVAMGRAIVRDPRVFLFDEPLSNLDAKLRVQMRAEIKELQQRLETTAVYVTHDQIEAMTMADEIVVLHDGHVEQIGTPLELYDRPANLFVASFIGSPAMNFLRGTYRRDGGSACVVLPTGAQVPAPLTGAADGVDVVYGVRPEHLALADGGEGLAGQVAVVEPTGADTHVVVRGADHEILAVFRERHAFQPGQQITLRPDVASGHLFEASGGTRLR